MSITKLVPVLFALASCGSARDPLPVVLGTGATYFEPLTDGESLPIILGPQGGYHIWMALRVNDPQVDRANVDLSGTLEDGGAAIGPPSHIPVVLTPVDGGMEAAGLRNFIDIPALVSGQRVVVHIEVTAPDGRHGSDTRVVVPQQ